MRSIFEQAHRQGQLLEGVVAEEAAEFVFRMILSLLSVDGPRRRSDAKQRQFVRTFCAGAIVGSAH